MAKVHESKPEVSTNEETVRYVNIELNHDQVIEALFMWMRLQNVFLPSQNPKDYEISKTHYNTWGVKLAYKQTF